MITSAGKYCRTSWHPKAGWRNVFLMLHHSSTTGTQELTLPRKCLGLGSTSSQPHTNSLGITHRGACRCWASCHPQDPILPSSHSPASSSLQPLCSTKQPSYTGLVNGYEGAPPGLPQLITRSTLHPSPHLSTLRPHSLTAVEASPRHTVRLC